MMDWKINPVNRLSSSGWRIPLFISILVLCLFPVLSAKGEPLEHRYIAQYRAPEWLASRIQPLLSPRGNLRINPSQRSIIISDDPQALAHIRTVLKRLDVPLRDLEITVQILRGEERQQKPSEDSVELPDVIKKMRAFLKFDHYTLLERGFVRTAEYKPTLLTLGEYRLSFTGQWLIEPDDVVRLENFKLEKKVSTDKNGKPVFRTLLSTTLNLRTGNPTVIGTAHSEQSPTILFLVLQVRLSSPGGL